MKKQRTVFALVAALLWLSGPVSAMASTVTLGDPSPAGIGYTWTVSMNGNDTTAGSTPNYAGAVGAYSFNDPSNFGDPIGTGWTHTSNWTALTLTQAANLNVTLAANGSGLIPAFALYAGQQLTGGDWHVFNTSGNFDWSTQGGDSSSLNYIANEANLGALSSISKTFSLGPGLYSLVFSGNAYGVTGAATGFLGYQATLTTAPVPVPAAVYLFGSGLIGLAGLARRRKASVS
jgi:hypothetical protein